MSGEFVVSIVEGECTVKLSFCILDYGPGYLEIIVSRLQVARKPCDEADDVFSGRSFAVFDC